jgi:hypothetical protein
MLSELLKERRPRLARKNKEKEKWLRKLLKWKERRIS